MFSFSFTTVYPFLTFSTETFELHPQPNVHPAFITPLRGGGQLAVDVTHIIALWDGGFVLFGVAKEDAEGAVFNGCHNG